MRLPGTGLFWGTATLIAAVALCLSPVQTQAQGDYEYKDSFDDSRLNFAESDSHRHSVFWPQGAFPPPQPYLYYYGDAESERELGFGGRHGEPAFLGYRFPAGPAQSHRSVSGSLKVDVRFPYDGSLASSLSSRLLYSVSADGVEWSDSEELEPGSHNIPISSTRGVCHIVFFGTEVLIDNLRVQLSTSPATIYVPGNYSTIQEAIDASDDGDVIQVSRGTYSGPGNRDIHFGGRAITVRGAGAGQTKIDCANHRGFYFRGGESGKAILRGFTIMGGRVPGSVIPSDGDDWNLSSAHPVGGGIFCEFSSPTIVDCVIENCSAEFGGGIGVVGGAPRIFDCVIENCQAGSPESGQSRGYGGGIALIRGAEARIFNCEIKNNLVYAESLGAGLYCRQSKATLVNCDVSYNSAQAGVNGGGVYCGGSGSGIVLEKCLISNNTAEAGGGVFTEQFDYARLTNCTVANNRLAGTAATIAGGIHSVGGDILIRNSIVWYNDGAAISLIGSVSPNPVLFSNVQGYYAGQGNINLNPSFRSPATGDYHLKSVTGRYDPYSDRWFTDNHNEHSPCIDAGDPQDPVGSEAFPNHGRINMGAYGGTTEASKSIGPLIFHVDRAGGSNFNKGLSRNDAFATIQYAVNHTINGDIILVWPGVYQEEISFDSKAITLQSADEAAVITAPNPVTGYAFSFSGAETSSSVVRNFVIVDCGKAAVYCDVASPTLTNLTVTDSQFGVVAVSGANPSITSCIFWNNADGDIYGCRAKFSCLQELRGLDSENGNISTDPFFADPENGDYHLQSRYGRYSAADNAWVVDALTSPCIDSGDPDVYPGRERAPHGGRVNMGAYGGTPSSSLSGGQSWDVVNSAVQVIPSN